MDEAIKAIFEGQDFSQEFKDKVVAVFESAVEEKTTQIQEEIEQKYEALSEEYSQYVMEEMETKTQEYIESEVIPMVEKYLDYSVGEFMTENKLAVESGTKVQLAEQFLTGLTGIAESFNVQVPEGQDDYIKEVERKLEEAQDRFDKALDQNAELQEQLQEVKKSDIVDSKVVDLTESQKEKFFKVASKVRFQDEEQYKEAIDELFESYFPTEERKHSDEPLTKQLDEQEQDQDKPTSFKSWEEELFSKL